MNASASVRTLLSAAIVLATTSAFGVNLQYVAKELYTLQAPAGYDYVLVNGFMPAGGGQVVGHVWNNSMAYPTRHAYVWSDSGTPGANLQPLQGFNSSFAYGTDGVQQTGYGNAAATFTDHALVWNGTAASAVDLNPAGFRESYGRGTAHSRQVGYGSGPATNSRYHALLWSGTAASAVDLNPAGYAHSWADSTDGPRQVGRARLSADNLNDHAMVWQGTAASAVDLHPDQFASSNAYGVHGNQQVGYGFNGGGGLYRALMWSGTAQSWVNLHPGALYTDSIAYGTNSINQVGTAVMRENGSLNHHAIAWSGRAEDYVDLDALLPASTTESWAYSIDEAGNIHGIALGGGSYHAYIWTPIPEPAFCLLVSTHLIAIACRPKRGRG